MAKPQAQEMMNFFTIHGLLSEDQLNIIFEEQQNSMKPPDQIGVDLKFYEKNDCLKLKALFYNIDYIDLENNIENGSIWSTLQEYNTILFALSAVAYGVKDSQLFVALSDPLDIKLKDKIRGVVCAHFPYIVKISFAFGNVEHDIYVQAKKQNISNIKTTEIIEELDALIAKAIDCGASDIHIRPDEKTTYLYFRLHGQLVLKKTWHKKFEARLLSRLKILSGLDIAQSRMPQSGSYPFKYNSRFVDLRISTHPTVYGERLAIRILDTHKNRHDLKSLGITGDGLTEIQLCLNKKQGLILVSGATGSGKTTTLYACLDYLNKTNLNIMTLEDPVESVLHYASQMEISPNVGYVDGLRSILRQDPDVILVGEIRDEDTAKMAFRAAMTGHLVLSTIHTQGLVGISTRLEDLDVKAHMIEEFLLCSIYQELNATYHDACQRQGCPACFGTGVIDRKLNFQISSSCS